MAVTLPLDQPAFNVNVGRVPWSLMTTGVPFDLNHKIYAQSRWTYSPKHKRLYFFGGGHASSPFDSMYSLDCDPASPTFMQWRIEYPEFPLALLQQIGGVPVQSPLPAGTPTWPDGSGKYDFMGYADSGIAGELPHKWWKRAEAGLPPPAWSPLARHNWTNLLYSPATGTIFCLTTAVSPPYLVAQASGGNWFEYDPDTRSYADVGFNRGKLFSDYYAPCVDPVSGNFILVCSRGFLVYDPRNKTTQPKVITINGLSALGQLAVLVYYPPTDTFYYVHCNLPSGTTDAPLIVECKLDRDGSKTGTPFMPIWSGPNPKVATPMSTNWRPRNSAYGSGYMFCYDADSQMIVGGQMDYSANATFSNPASIYGFKPGGNNAGTWFNQSIAPQQALLAGVGEYVPELRCHILGSCPYSPGDMWATRLDPSAWVENVDLRPPQSVISGNGKTYTTLQAAVTDGGSLTLGAGVLQGSVGAATITKPVSMTATGATIQGALVSGGSGSGQGSLVTFADTTIDGLTIKAVPSNTSGVGAVRLQAGNLALSTFWLEDAPDGILAGPAEASTVTLNHGTVAYCGTTDGQAHYLYIHKIDTFNANGVTCKSGTRGAGNMFKSKARETNIINCIAGTDLTGTESYECDFEQGGNVTIGGCTALKGPNASNPVVLNYGRQDDVRWYPGGDRCYVHDTVIENRQPVGKSAIGLRNYYPDPRPDGGPGVTCYAENVTFKGQYALPTGGTTRLYFSGKWKYRNCRYVADDGTVTPLPDTWDASPLPDPDRAPPPLITDVQATPQADGTFLLQFRVRYATANAASSGITLNGVTIPYAANTPVDSKTNIPTSDVMNALGWIYTVPKPAGSYTLIAHGPTAPDATVTLSAGVSTPPADTTPPAAPSNPLTASFVRNDTMYDVTLSGVAGPETDIAEVDVYVDADAAAHTAAVQPSKPFSLVVSVASSGDHTVKYGFKDAVGNIANFYTQTITVPDMEAPAAPTQPLTVVTVVWTAQ